MEATVKYTTEATVTYVTEAEGEDGGMEGVEANVS